MYFSSIARAKWEARVTEGGFDYRAILRQLGDYTFTITVYTPDYDEIALLAKEILIPDYETLDEAIKMAKEEASLHLTQNDYREDTRH